ncbi:MAG: peroxiredoxin family protein [Faecousia sp.]
MNKLKKILSILLVLAMLLSLTVSMTGCNGGGGEETTGSTSGSEPAANKSYTVTIRTKGGMVLSGIQVYVYADNTLSDLKQYGETDESGSVSFELPASSDYAITLSGVPKGYRVEPSYSFSGSTARIELTSSLITGESLSETTLGLGDVMYDFTVTTAGGESVTLSQLLSEKKMVMLNFWYTTCSWCLTEFPFMEQAYEQYSEDVGIIALNPLEDNNAVKVFQADNGLTFPMAACPAAWANTFGISGYPTSVFIDRYGVICMIEVGGVTSLRPFVNAFGHFTAEDYQQALYNNISELVSNVKPTYTMDTSEDIGAAINSGDIEVTYRPETEGVDAEYSWPFILTGKNGEVCLKASNQEIESSFAILYADITLKAGQAMGFDYLASTESGADVLYVIVNDRDIYQISGVSEPERWQSCYPWVAEEDGVYELALCYLKDSSDSVGDDTVYIKDMRVVDASEIDTATYIPREAAISENGFDFTYADIFLNPRDGYYHVGSEDGPLLLADLMNYTQFNEENTVFDLAYDGTITVDGHNYYDELVRYCSYASNSQLSGVCTVNEELAELLKIVASVAGFDGTENEWLKLCRYYQAFGTGGVQLSDPVAGLATFSAYTATLGKDVPTNYFYYDRAIMPRGLLAKFVPTTSGVYRITSRNDSPDGVDAWIFSDDREITYTYQQDERMYNDDLNVSIVYYMEAGQEYYIDIAFWDVYYVGYIYYDIEFIGTAYDLFRSASPGPFTYDTNATGDAMYTVITGGIDVVLGPDGCYHEDLGLDENGNQKYGSLLYADFTGICAIFNLPIATVNSYDENGNPVLDESGNPVKISGMIDLGGFDFSKSENDAYILSIMKRFDGDVEATDAYLREQWGEDYEARAETYQLEDIYEGRYHGDGADYTDEIRTYLSQILDEAGHPERQGCVVVTQRLAEILQMLMDKYTFKGVEHCWTKLCYYYDYLGSQG